MDENGVKEIVQNMVFWNGKKEVSIDEIAVIQPGLARIMPEIGVRAWKLYYAAKAENWTMALFQWHETKNLFELGALVRPKHAEAIEEYLEKDWATLEEPLKNADLPGFLKAYDACIVSANAWHDQKKKPFIQWKVPDTPPPDLDLTPRK